jgi:AmiR/NasT family two-component response regulator
MEYGMSEFDAIILEAARLLALERNVSAATAHRLIRTRALESGRFIGAVARDIASRLSVTDDRSP